MKSILLPIEFNRGSEPAVRLACFWARMFDSYIEAFPLQPLPPPSSDTDLVGAIVHNSELDRSERIENLREGFHKTMEEQGIPPATLVNSSFSYGWSDDTAINLGPRGRAFDITVVGRPGASVKDPLMSTLEAALFESGRPILIAPPAAVTDVGKTVLIAWNGSVETARAIAFAMPVLRRASQVLVLTVEDGSKHQPAGGDVARYLRRAGIEAEALSAAAGRKTVGETILEQASNLRADLLVKGAYTRSRLRQMIFGGATRHIIAKADVPVLMAH